MRGRCDRRLDLQRDGVPVDVNEDLVSPQSGDVGQDLHFLVCLQEEWAGLGKGRQAVGSCAGADSRANAPKRHERSLADWASCLMENAPGGPGCTGVRSH